jgi:hypothetical protein
MIMSRLQSKEMIHTPAVITKKLKRTIGHEPSSKRNSRSKVALATLDIRGNIGYDVISMRLIQVASNLKSQYPLGQ